ncbi:MAG: LysM peptidoglycan-binding domain-containing protein [Candidatus Omnitrophota bacterium]|nr:MAG: LysM peptidoglycan-binding domain-containing protein [Candidatus Omnitrophota bacterium]
MNRRVAAVVVACVLLVVVGIALRATVRPRQVSQGKITGGDSAAALLMQAKELESKNSFLEATQIYQRLVSEYPASKETLNWQKKSEDLNIKLLFSPVVTPKSTLYEVKPGDTLTKISKAFNTTVELIKKGNNLADDTIIPGRKLKVWTAPFTIFVDKSQNLLILKNDDEIIKTYVVATGANNSTPIGTFKITNKLQNPTWFKAGAVVASDSPENILGSRWLGFELAGYGIHGTTDPQSLGKQVTQGCVRMSNQDVEELYSIVPVGTEVTIVD